MSHRTKAALAAALKQAMAKKPLSKITIRELIEACDINRQTFYYHFSDIYDLVKWTYKQDADALINGRKNVLLWQDGLLQLLHYLDDNRAVCLCALRSIGREHIHQMLYSDLYDLIHQTIADMGKELNIPAEQKDEHIDTLTQFCIASLIGTMECWLDGTIVKTPEELAAFADNMIRNLIAGERLQYGVISESPADRESSSM